MEKKFWKKKIGHEIYTHPKGPICIGVILEKTLFKLNGPVNMASVSQFLEGIIYGIPPPCQAKIFRFKGHKSIFCGPISVFF